MNSQYDSRTAITFLVVGLGIGALLTVMFAPERRGQGLRRGVARLTAPESVEQKT